MNTPRSKVMPMTDGKPKWNRRKDARPAEILNAAIDVFSERGFATARLDEVAQRAGVVKGTLYRYFATKEELFKAVVHQTLAAHLETVERSSAAFEGSLVEFVPMLLERAALRLGDSRFPAIARVVLTESRSFPDLAAVWHDELVSRMLNLVTGMITKAQKSGEVRPGDPKLYAFSILGPMVTGVLFHEVFGNDRPTAPDLKKLASQHAELVLRGLLVAPQKEGG
ncbi:TetR/AcrR family transcriptional regulator [Burkholderia multivorans]|uniref:TetR/AcrR family transcriptional regulator n=2 Tax=Burkholderia multivorans TaxID=87883 RepID=UPI001C616641|nr:TetR/AcrR family transcriptional regulator [Burkholderia multivorans]